MQNHSFIVILTFNKVNIFQSSCAHGVVVNNLSAQIHHYFEKSSAEAISFRNEIIDTVIKYFSVYVQRTLHIANRFGETTTERTDFGKET